MEKENTHMRDPKRIDEVLKELGKFWKKNPDIRFFQLLIAFIPINNFKGDLFNYEDSAFLEQLKELNK